MTQRRTLWITVVLLAVFIPNTLADESQLMEMVQQLQEQMAELQNTIHAQNDKIRQLELRATQVQVSPSVTGQEASLPMSDQEFSERLGSALGGADAWLKDLRFSGDMRLRYEAFQFSSGNPKAPDDRNRFRLRLRYGFEKKFSDDMKIGFRMITGEQESGFHKEPASGNQTFTNLFNYKNIWIEKAYATYTPHFLKRGPIEKVNITAGKFDNPFEQAASDLVWDRDVKPEGIYEQVDFKFFDTEDFKLGFYALAGQFILQESSSIGKDANLFAYQMGIKPVLSLPFLERPAEVLSAISYYDYDNYTRKSNFFIGGTINASNNNFNVDSDPTTLDARNFNIVESYNELAIFPFGVPVRFSFDFARNTREAAVSPSVTNGDNAYGFGIALGKMKKKRDWEIGYNYKYLPANSMVGAFADSDFGAGFVGHRGNVFKAGYQLTDSIAINAAAFFVENTNPDSAGVIDLQQRRFQVDMTWKF